MIFKPMSLQQAKKMSNDLKNECGTIVRIMQDDLNFFTNNFTTDYGAVDKMTDEQLYNEIMNCFAWWEIEDEAKQEQKDNISQNNKQWLTEVLEWFEEDFNETGNLRDKTIIKELKRRLAI